MNIGMERYVRSHRKFQAIQGVFMEFILENMSLILYSILSVLGLVFSCFFIKDLVAHRHELEPETNTAVTGVIGFVTSFFDALGIGNFATITALMKIFKQTKDRMIPGILNVGLTIPVITEAVIFIKKVEVEPITLFSMLFAAAFGAYIGAGFIARFSEQRIRLIMGVALLITVFVMLAGIMGWMPVGGDAIGLSGYKLIIAVVANFILGALMTAGIGMYAPCMAMVYFMGMNPLIAFPIMMGSAAVLMPVASYRFIKEGAYNRKAAMVLTISGVAGLSIAIALVTSMPLDKLRWLVMAVVFYTSIAMLRSYYKCRKASKLKIVNNVQEKVEPSLD